MKVSRRTTSSARSPAAPPGSGTVVLISTGDKDMAQLVDGSITLINTMSNSVLDRAGVKAKFDVFPEQIIDYLALVGDSSDNIPGIEKVGPKTAAKWLGQYGTLDNLVAHAQEISGKVGENLRAGLATLELSRKLATIHTNLEMPLSSEQLIPAAPDTEQLRELYTRYELRSLLRQLDGGESLARLRPPVRLGPRVGAAGDTAVAEGSGADAAAAGGAGPGAGAEVAGGAGVAPTPHPLSVIERHYETITTWADLERWITALSNTDLFAFDTETTNLDYMKAEVVGLSFCIEAGVAAYVPLHHDYAGAPEQLDRERVLAALKPILEDPERGKVGHHLKYDAHVLSNHGVNLLGMRFDTMLESYVWNSVGTRHDMDSVALCYLGMRTITFEDIAGKGAKQLTFNQVPVDKASAYAAEDADVTLCMHKELWSKLADDSGLATALLGARATAGAGAAANGASRSAGRSQPVAPAEPGDRDATAAAAGTGPQGSRCGVQYRVAETAAADSVREAADSGDAQDSDRAALDRGGRAGGAGELLRPAADRARLPGAGEAQIHLHGQASRADQRADGAHSHLVSPGRGGDRTPVFRRS